MFEIKQGVASRVPVYLSTSAGVAVNSALFSDVACTVLKADGSTANLTIASGTDFIQVTSGQFSGQGVYWLLIPASAASVQGMLTYVIVASVGSAKPYRGTVKVVTNEEVDTFARLGAPAGASHAADVAAIQTKLGTPVGASVIADITSVQTKLGTPAGASIAADIATANAALVSHTSSLSTLTTNVGTVNTNVLAVNTKLGTPAGASVSADIATANSTLASHTSSLSTINTKLGTPAGASISADIASVEAKVATLKKYEEGRWKIHTSGADVNRLVLYDTDGVTALLKFDLKDAAGDPTFVNPFERVKVFP